MKNRKIQILSIALVLGLVVITIGTTLAFFNYVKQGSTENTVSAGRIKFHYNEDNSGITLDDVIPMSDTEGKKQTDYFEFTITSETMDTVDIPYYVTIRRSGTGTNMDNIVKVYLTKVNGNKETEVALYKYSELGTYTNNSGITIPATEKLLYRDKVYAGDTNYNQTYRLRMWIDESAEFLVQTNEGDIYPYEDKTYTLNVNVYSNGETVNANEVSLRENVDIEDVEIGNNVVVANTTSLSENEEMPVGQTTMTKTITINTVNPDAVVTVRKINDTALLNTNRISSDHTIELGIGENVFEITVSSVTGRSSKTYTLTITVAYPTYEVGLSGTNVTFDSESLNITNGGTGTVAVTPSTGYYLSSVSCSTGYTNNATTGTAAISAQLVTITNQGVSEGGTCTFTATKIVPTVSITGSNVVLGSESINVDYDSYNTVTVTPVSGYYLSNVSCLASYTHNATTGISATGSQTVTITNTGTYSNGACTFTASPYYTTTTEATNSFTSAQLKDVIMCDYGSSKLYNCETYTSFTSALSSRNNGYVFPTHNLTSTSEIITVNQGKTIYFDLNGKTLSYNKTYNFTGWGNSKTGILNYGTVTLKDSKSNGSINTDEEVLANMGTATIVNGEYGGQIWNANYNGYNGTLTIAGGTFTSNKSGFAAIFADSSRNTTISSASVTSLASTGISNAGSGTIRVSSTTISSYTTGLHNESSGNIYFSSGTITTTNTGTFGAFSTSTATGTIKICGGTVKGKGYDLGNSGNGYVYYNNSTGTSGITFTNGKGNPTKGGTKQTNIVGSSNLTCN